MMGIYEKSLEDIQFVIENREYLDPKWVKSTYF
jgi:hypothetical protein